MKTCPSCTWNNPTAASRGAMSRWAIATVTGTRYLPAWRPATGSSLRAVSSFASSRANERATAVERAGAALRIGDQSHRRLRLGTAVPDHSTGGKPDWRRLVGAQAPAHGCVSGSVATDRGDHHAMARTFRRGN